MTYQEEIARLRTENAALQNEARQIWAQVPDGYKLSSGARPLEAIRLMVEGLWAMSEELRALCTENARLDRIAMDYYERFTDAQEEINRLQSGIAALREQWQARRDAWQSRFDAEDKPSEYADALTERVRVISVVIEELDALFPVETSYQGDIR